jgi:hypothetical protein
MYAGYGGAVNLPIPADKIKRAKARRKSEWLGGGGHALADVTNGHVSNKIPRLKANVKMSDTVTVPPVG